LRPVHLCKCSCGKEKFVQAKNLISGRVKSCGCLAKTCGGLSKTLLGMVWRSMIQRCHKISKSNKNYRDRGIKVCTEWQQSLPAFYAWAMSNGYKKGLTIDRINNDGNYEPNNCRWVSNKENCNNKRPGKGRDIARRKQYEREYYLRVKAKQNATSN
jgi:hypothetical protein